MSSIFIFSGFSFSFCKNIYPIKVTGEPNNVPKHETLACDIWDIGIVYTFCATRNGISLARREQRTICTPPPHVVLASPAHGNAVEAARNADDHKHRRDDHREQSSVKREAVISFAVGPHNAVCAADVRPSELYGNWAMSGSETQFVGVQWPHAVLRSPDHGSRHVFPILQAHVRVGCCVRRAAPVLVLPDSMLGIRRILGVVVDHLVGLVPAGRRIEGAVRHRPGVLRDMVYAVLLEGLALGKRRPVFLSGHDNVLLRARRAFALNHLAVVGIARLVSDDVRVRPGLQP
eukprot:scaffold104489_cov69-Phaeocystis_antarctica.AAC.2